MEFSELLTEIISKDPELRKGLKAKISKSLDQVDITQDLQDMLSQTMENIEIDLSPIINKLVQKVIQNGINQLNLEKEG